MGHPPWIYTQLLAPISFSYRVPQNVASTGVIQRKIPAGLDTTYPYGSYGDVNSNNEPTTRDSPGIGLEGAFTYKSTNLPVAVGEVAEGFAATMYMLWDPLIPPAGLQTCSPSKSTFDNITKAVGYTNSTCASIPVPMASVSWTFNGDAIKTLNPSLGTQTNTWIYDGGTNPPVAAGPSGYPVWSCTSGVSKSYVDTGTGSPFTGCP